MKTAIVTGGTGFIGRNLIRRLLREDYRIYALVRPESRNQALLPAGPGVIPVECAMEDIQKKKDLLPEQADAFFHFAWGGVNRDEIDDDRIHTRSLESSLNILETAVGLGCRCFVFAGSRTEYGRPRGPWKETLPCAPEVAYGRAKLRFGELARERCGNTETTYIHPRIFSVYGPDDHPWSLVSTCVRKMLAGEDVDLSECTQRWNFIDIEDTVDLLLTLAEQRRRIPAGDTGIFNVATDDIRPLKAFVEEIRQVTRSTSGLNYGFFRQRPESALSLEPDMTKVETVFGWRQKVPFAEGIRRMAEAAGGKA